MLLSSTNRFVYNILFQELRRIRIWWSNLEIIYWCYVMCCFNTLIVTASCFDVPAHDPECTSNSGESIEEGDIVWIQCQFEFRGNLIPYLECERNTTKGRHVLEIVNVTRSGSNVLFSVSDLVDRTSHGSVCLCMVRFKTPANERRGKSSSNVTVVLEPPDYNFTWITPPLDVLCEHFEMFHFHLRHR